MVIIVSLEKLLIALLLPCHSPIVIGSGYHLLLLLLNGFLWLLLLHVLVKFSLLLFHLVFDLSLKELAIHSFQNAYCNGQGKDVVVSYLLEHVVPPRGTETFGGPILEKLERYDLHVFVSFIFTFLLLRNLRFMVVIIRIRYLFRAILLVLLLHQGILVYLAVFVPEHVWVGEALVKDHQLLAKLIDSGRGLNSSTDFVSGSFESPLTLESET